MMKLKRVLAVGLACILMFVIPVVSVAEGNSGVSPRYSYTWSVEAGLEISSSGNALCLGQIVVYDASSTISMKVSLYQQTTNGWDRLTSWYGTSTGETSLDMARNYQLPEYGLYKVLVTGTVTGADGGSEWISLESDQLTYP